MSEGTRREFWFRTLITALVLLLAGVGYFMVDANSRADQQARTEQAAKDDADNAAVIDDMCERVAAQNQRMRDLLTITGAERVPPEGSTPAQLEGYRVANEERAKLRALGDTLFEPQVCADGLPPTPYTGTTTTAP